MAVDIADPEQFELIHDDPRVSAKHQDGFEMLRQWREARKEFGDLVTRSFAASVLGVSTGQIATWCARGRFTDIAVGHLKVIALSELEALRRERIEADLPVGGRGKKSPSMGEVIKLSLQGK